jgi:mannose-6-phosphate isomerase-like protein (cupin superfamily)
MTRKKLFKPGNVVHHKPWGNYKILFKGSDFQVKRVELDPGSRLSLQKHLGRSEKWTVISGTGLATVGSKKTAIKRESVVEIPSKKIHRLHNTGRAPLVVIEVQFGDYLGEDDIIRFQDDFGRA